MLRTISWVSLFLVCLAWTISAAAQTSDTSQGPTAPNQQPQIQNPGNLDNRRPPDIVCFGYGPNWSIQFVNGAARYLGINQPDQTLLGDFYYVPQDKAWEWHRANGLAPMNGSFDLSATIQKQACNDPVRKMTFPYSAQVNLPQGDMVSGCCRKLKPGEAPVGKHGLPPQPGQQQPGAQGQGSSSQPSGQPSPDQSQPSGQGQKKPQPQ
jgi:uncharacterized membrane protein